MPAGVVPAPVTRPVPGKNVTPHRYGDLMNESGTIEILLANLGASVVYAGSAEHCPLCTVDEGIPQRDAA